MLLSWNLSDLPTGSIFYRKDGGSLADKKNIVNFSQFVDKNAKMVEKQTGHAVRPRNKAYNEDGFVNMLTNYGTSKDSSEYYQYMAEEPIMDDELERFYEGNGLFSRIIDLPAEEAIKHGFEIKDLAEGKTKDFFDDCMDELDWEEKFMTALKWARLYGGSIGVMLIDDGRGLEEELDWKSIKSIDEIKVYDRSLLVPDYSSMYKYDGSDPFRARGSRFGMPESYMVTSKYGSFRVHESRCLIFQNGVLPERSTNEIYQMWGVPEYLRIHRAVKDVEVAHGMGPKMLDRSVQAIYKMQNLALEMATEQGEENVLRRLQVIDLARGFLNSIVLDADGEDYDFKSFSFSGVSDVINTTCNYLSAVTNIPQTILFGRSPAGMNATGSSDLENYYNYVERIQKRIVKKNLIYLLTVVACAGVHTKEIDEVPPLKIEFNSLWSMTEQEKVALDLQKAQLASTNANTANVYVQMQAIDPQEVRNKLAEDGEFDIETMLDDYTEEELEENNPANKQQGGDDPMAAMMGMMGGGGAPDGGGAPGGEAQGADPMGGMMPQKAPEEAQQAPEVQESKDAPKPPKAPQEAKMKPQIEEQGNVKKKVEEDEEDVTHKLGGVGVVVVKDGKVLTATRLMGKGIGLIGGPGGHIEEGEKAKQAAVRETFEEFGIIPKNLIRIGSKLETGHEVKVGGDNAEHLRSTVFLCTEFEGEPECDGVEMAVPVWRDLQDLYVMDDRLFKPFKDGLKMLKNRAARGIVGENKESWDGKK